jgi:hypothetical protein
MLIPEFKVVVFCNIAEIFFFHKYRSDLDMWQIVTAQLRRFEVMEPILDDIIGGENKGC